MQDEVCLQKSKHYLKLVQNKQTLKALYTTLCLAILLTIVPVSGEAVIFSRTDTLKRQSTDTTVVLTAKERAKKERERRLAIKAAEKERQLARKDSIFAYKDSVIRATPRVLESRFFPDSIIYKRMFIWKNDTYFNKPTLVKADTTFNDNFTESPLFKRDVNAVYLGISGSAAQYFNYFIREEQQAFPFMSPYLPYTVTPQTINNYNVKTPYTELCYWGTLFANKQKEETNLKFLHTQNFTPALNFNIMYQRFGGNGMLQSEKTDDRTLALTANYLGKRYMAQGGYIFSRVERRENGGISDLKKYLDTIVDVRTIPVYLSDARSQMKRSTFFISHSLGIPLNFFRKKDSLSFGEGTMAYVGHYGEYSSYSRSYNDVIALSDTTGRKLYNNNFYINPTTSADVFKLTSFDNRFYIRLQPWAKEAIVSKLDAGIGYKILRYYAFKENFFLTGNKHFWQNNPYLYFGASGKFRRYFEWNGLGTYQLAGYYKNDFSIDGNIRFSAYPIKEGVHLSGHLAISQKNPDYFYNHYYSNHYIWNNNFDKTTETKIEAKLSIPYWKFEAFFGYSMLKNNVYLDTLGMASQNGNSMSIISAYLQKNFTIWKLHLDNRVLFQVSSDQKVVPLPKIALNLRYYFEFTLVKNVLTSQIGANATFNTKYYMPGYSPALGLFYNQREMEIGNKPYVDIFINLQWKRASIFVKYVNAADKSLSKEYFSAYRYIRPQSSLKFGIYWPFYIQ